MGEVVFMTSELRNKLIIDDKRLKEINEFILDPDNKIINSFIEIVEKYG